MRRRKPKDVLDRARYAVDGQTTVSAALAKELIAEVELWRKKFYARDAEYAFDVSRLKFHNRLAGNCIHQAARATDDQVCDVLACRTENPPTTDAALLARVVNEIRENTEDWEGIAREVITIVQAFERSCGAVDEVSQR